MFDNRNNIFKIIGSVLLLVMISIFFATNVYASSQIEQNISINSGMIILFLIITVMIILFFSEILRVDIVALSIPVILVILNPWTKISVEEALSGFSNKATITILAMFILSESVKNNGFVQIIGDEIADLTGKSEKKQLFLICLIAGISAAFLNNTPVVAIFIPIVVNLSRKTKTSPSKILMPLSYASMMGGVVTLIGTSTNLLASDISARLIDHPFSMFEFTKMGVIIFAIGLIYLVTVGYLITPRRVDPDEEFTEGYKIEYFLSEIIISPKSPFIGKSINQIKEEKNYDMDVIKILRSEKSLEEPLSSKTLKEQDQLLIRMDKETLEDIMQSEYLEFATKTKTKKSQIEEDMKKILIEVVIPNGSGLEDKKMEEIDFLNTYNSYVLAVKRGRELPEKLKDIRLRPGDVLLLLGTEKTLGNLERIKRDFIIIYKETTKDYKKSKMITSLGIMAVVIALAVFEIVPIVVSALMGVLAMIITGCIKPNQIYQAVDWKVIILLAGLIPLGISMEKTGTAEYIAVKLLSITSDLPVIVILGIFYLFTAVLTQLISNNASVVLMLPIVIDVANKLGANPFAFVLAVTFAASNPLLTPVGYQTNLMVYGPGNYKFIDFAKVGAPLQIILAIVTPLFISIFWGL